MSFPVRKAPQREVLIDFVNGKDKERWTRIKASKTRIKPEDGTVLRGRAGFGNGEAHGTVVYTKRTKLVLGGE